MPPCITDDVLHTGVLVGIYEEIGQKLLKRYGEVITQVEFSIQVRDGKEEEILRELVREVQKNRINI